MFWILSLLSFTPALGGTSKAQPYYETREMRITLPDNLSRASLGDLLRNRMSKKGVKVLAIEQADGTRLRVTKPRDDGAPRFKNLTYSSIIASFVPFAHDLKGAEMDVFVHNEKKEIVPVSLWWDAPERTFVIREGKPIDSLFLPAPDGLEVVKTFGIGPLVSVGRQWSPEAIGLLYSALSLLSPEEVARLEGVPFHRAVAPSKALKRRVVPAGGKFSILEAVYSENANEQGGQIFVFDSALKITGRFSGEPEDPKPASLLTLLHEMGHALARQPVRDLIAKHTTLYEEFESNRQAYNALLDRRNQVYNTHRDNPSDKVIATVKKMDDSLTEMNHTLEKAQSDLVSIKALNQAYNQGTPAARALIKVMGKLKRAPTIYGRTGPEEAFAECFALYHLDPRALKRSVPEVYDWFKRGEHLRAQDELLKDPGSDR